MSENSIIDTKEIRCAECGSQTFRVWKLTYDDLSKQRKFKIICELCENETVLNPSVLPEGFVYRSIEEES